MWLRLRQIALVARELRPVVDDLTAVLGIELCYVDPGVETFGLENALLPVGNQLLEVVAPIAPGTAGGRYLERRGGDGGYMVITQCDDHAARRKRVEELGIRLVLSFEVPGEFRNMQLHPKDTGGAFFEIDEQLGSARARARRPVAPRGSRLAARAAHGRVRAITAAELQCPDPAKTAARWSEIVEIPVARDAPAARRSRSTTRRCASCPSTTAAARGSGRSISTWSTARGDRCGARAAEARERRSGRARRAAHEPGLGRERER